MNLLHPLTSLKWSEYCKMPVNVYSAQAVVLRNKAYLGGGSMYLEPSSRLLVYDFTKNSWDTLKTPTEDYALATFHSQLVLVGGRYPDTGRATNQLWVLDEQDHWSQPFPPMKTERYLASVVSVGDHLLVAGGFCSGGVIGHVDTLDVVEVYDSHQWKRVRSVPRALWHMKSAVLGGNWYLTGETKQVCKVYYTSLESLIATSEEAGQTSVWKNLPNTPLESSTLAVLSNQLITLGTGYNYNTAIRAHSTDSWVHVGDLPVACYSPCALVPTGDRLLVVVGTESGPASCLFRANLGATSFPDGHFDMSALDRLEKVAGISIFNKLAPKFLEVASTLDFDESTLDSLRIENNPVEGSKDMMKAWLSGKSALPSTWQVLLEKLQGVERELAQEIKHFFKGTPVTSLSLPLISDSKKEELELGLSALEKKEQQTKPDYREAAVQTHGEATAAETTGYLRGLDVIAETSVLVTNQAQTFHWVGYGLKLHIPQGALPAGLEECRLLIKVGLSGQFAFPQNTSLVSAVYWLDSEPRRNFSQPLTLEIQHCAMPSQTSRPNFAIAKCSQRNLPYTFETVDEGKFSSQSAYGCIQLDSFSLIALVKRLILGEDNTKYRASLYYLKERVDQREIHFVVTKDQEAHVTVVQQKYTSKSATIGPDLRVEFEAETISLQLPSEEETLGGGWRIVPLFSPVITKEDVDSHKPNQRIPSCQLTAEWTKKSKPSRLIYKVTLTGAKEPFNYFCIVLDCDSISPAGLHTKYPAGLNSQPELPDLMNEVAAEIPSKWRSMGLQLGVDHSVLEGIALISPGDINRCYSNVFTRWKNQNSTTYPYTWSTIVQALESRAVGEKRLADKIKNELTPQ